ncbi:MAG TPA: malate synthase A [Gemmatimonadales bacterium]
MAAVGNAASRHASSRDEVAGPSVTLTRPVTASQREILTPEALRFIAALHHTFESRRQALLTRRRRTRQRIRSGWLPQFRDDTREIRDADWRVAPSPADLCDRRVEITGPVDRKLVINALNSGANVYMADFEDSHSPTWANTLDGQVNLRDAVTRSISFTSPEGKHYALSDQPAVLLVRPRGWHLPERHCLVDGAPIAGSLFDFGLYLYHNATQLLERGTGPYFYLPKLENADEAQLWNDVFEAAQAWLDIPRGTIRATVLIEHILAAFEMDEILWALRDHSAGLNCGRWDYIFSFIKTFAHRPEFVLPDRGTVGMDRHFLDAYVQLLIRTCHRRGIHAMGGMAAQIPIKADAVANMRAIEKVRQDKLREVTAGHDGTWVAHPGLVTVARSVFDEYMPWPNQIEVPRDPVHIAAADLLAVPAGSITRSGLRHNIDVGIRYLESWLRGSGCVPIYHLMEDAATAEISRTQVWQWVRHEARMDDGQTVTAALVGMTILDVMQALRAQLGGDRFAGGKFTQAARIFQEITTADEPAEWLTTVAYQHLD